MVEINELNRSISLYFHLSPNLYWQYANMHPIDLILLFGVLPGFPNIMPRIPSLLISPKSPSSSRECSAIMEEEDDSMSMDQTLWETRKLVTRYPEELNTDSNMTPALTSVFISLESTLVNVNQSIYYLQ